MTNDRPRSPGDLKWIVVVFAASILGGIVLHLWTNAPPPTDPVRIDALDRPLGDIPDQPPVLPE